MATLEISALSFTLRFVPILFMPLIFVILLNLTPVLFKLRQLKGANLVAISIIGIFVGSVTTFIFELNEILWRESLVAEIAHISKYVFLLVGAFGLSYFIHSVIELTDKPGSNS